MSISHGYYDTSYPPSLWEPVLPDVASISPTTVVISTPVNMTVTGTGFQPTSVVKWNGVAKPTTYVSDTQLTCTGTAPATAGTVTVTVSTGTDVSDSATLTVTATGTETEAQAPQEAPVVPQEASEAPGGTETAQEQPGATGTP